MDSDQDSADDWVVLDFSTAAASDDDDDRVLALSSGCATPDSDSDTAAEKLALAAAYPADDAEGVYALSDAEDEDAYPPPPPPLPKPLAGLFHHTLAGTVAYAAFDPVVPHGHHGIKQLVPDPTFSAFFHEPVAALASTSGLVCLRGSASGDYYVANPATFKRARLPRHTCDHFTFGDPAVVVAFDLDTGRDGDHNDDHDNRCFYRHYHVAVAFPVGGGIYAFESFSSRTWAWTIGTDLVPGETVVHASGVGALGCAFWRTTMGYFLCYEPISGRADLIPAPEEVLQWPRWELGEMEGSLCATCMDERVNAVVVIYLDLARYRSNGDIASTLAGHFEGGCLRGRQDVTLLRSQGKAEVVMWDPRAEMVVAMDLEGRITRTIGPLAGRGYYADFIPYVSSLAGIFGSRTTASDEVSAGRRTMAADAKAH